MSLKVPEHFLYLKDGFSIAHSNNQDSLKITTSKHKADPQIASNKNQMLLMLNRNLLIRMKCQTSSKIMLSKKMLQKK